MSTALEPAPHPDKEPDPSGGELAATVRRLHAVPNLANSSETLGGSIPRLTEEELRLARLVMQNALHDTHASAFPGIMSTLRERRGHIQ